MSDSSYTDLAQRIEESFAEIEDEAIADFKRRMKPMQICINRFQS